MHAPAVIRRSGGSSRAFRVQINPLEAVRCYFCRCVNWLTFIYPVVSGYLAPGLGLIWLIWARLVFFGLYGRCRKAQFGVSRRRRRGTGIASSVDCRRLSIRELATTAEFEFCGAIAPTGDSRAYRSYHALRELQLGVLSAQH